MSGFGLGAEFGDEIEDITDAGDKPEGGLKPLPPAKPAGLAPLGGPAGPRPGRGGLGSLAPVKTPGELKPVPPPPKGASSSSGAESGAPSSSFGLEAQFRDEVEAEARRDSGSAAATKTEAFGLDAELGEEGGSGGSKAASQRGGDAEYSLAKQFAGADEKQRGGEEYGLNAELGGHATKIQASYRGYKVRKKHDYRRQTSDYLLERQTAERVAGRPVPEPIEPPRRTYAQDEAHAATKIQAHYRGYTVRRPAKPAARALPFKPPPLELSGEPSMRRDPGSSYPSSYSRREADEDALGLGQWQDKNAGLAAWELFSQKQHNRYTKFTALQVHNKLPGTMGYRMRLQYVSIQAAELQSRAGMETEFRIGVSFFDEATGSFYGNTCSSLPCVAVPAPAAEGAPITLELQQDVYYHTTLADTRSLLVLDLICIERHAGVPVHEYSIGWSALPTVQAKPQAAGTAMQANVKRGSLRYLMWGLPCVGHPAPAHIEGAAVVYQLEACPALLSAHHLFPPDCLLTFNDVVPGLCRFDHTGALTLGVAQVTSSLANPILTPVMSVILRNVCISLPPLFHTTLSDLVTAISNGEAPSYQVRLTPHNSRTFVGQPVVVESVSYMHEAEMLEINGDLQVDNLPGDQLVVLFLELLLTGPANSRPLVVGWAPVMPFQHLDDHTLTAPHIREGRYEVELREGIEGWLRDEPLCDFRGLLATTPPPPPPIIYFALSSLGVVAQPSPPALHDTAPAYQPPPVQESLQLLPDVPLRALSDDLAATRIQSQYRGYKIRSQQPGVKRSTYVKVVKPAQPAEAPAPLSAAAPQAAPAVARQAPAPLAPLPPPPGEKPPLMGLLAGQQAAQLDAMKQMQAMQMEQLSAIAPPDSTLGLVAAQQHQQLASLAAAMQAQLNQLASMVQGLAAGQKDSSAEEEEAAAHIQRKYRRHQERKELKIQQDNAARKIQGKYRSYTVRRQRARELDHLADMPSAVRASRDRPKFAGAEQRPRGEWAGPSRAVRGKLHHAGAAEALPADVRAMLRNKQGPARGPAPGVLDLDLESRDLRVQSDIIVQLLAYRKHDAFNVPTTLRNLYFNFQFFDFPPSTSERVSMEPNADNSDMCILVREGAKASETSAEPSIQAARAQAAGKQLPGLLMKFSVGGSDDCADESPEAMQARRQLFNQYLLTRALSIDVFDGDSLLQHGTLSVDLRGLLRQGREFSEVLLECPVLDHRDANPEEAARNRRRRGALRLAIGDSAAEATPGGGAAAVARGALLVRLINIGRPDKNFTRLPGPGAAPGPGGARGAVQAARGGAASRKARVRAVPESGGVVAHDLGAAILGPSNRAPSSSGRDPAGPAPRSKLSAKAIMRNIRGELAKAEERKLKRQARLKQLRTGEAPPQLYPEDEEKLLREHMLHDIEHARDTRKKALIQEQLRSAISTAHPLQAAFGETLFFEHELRNPYATDACFIVDIDESSRGLELVTDAAHWRALRTAARFPGAAGGVEDDAFSSGNRIFLAGEERVMVPFKYQSVDPARHIGAQQSRGDGAQTSAMLGVEVIQVSFLAEPHYQAAALMEVHVSPLPLVIDRTFRFYSAEHDFFKHRLRVPPPPPLPGAGSVAGSVHAGSELVVRCSDSAAVVGCSASREGGPKDEISIKFKCAAAPHSSEMFLLLYRDRYMAHLSETWQVFMHSLRRVDVSGVVGQSTSSSVVIRGTDSSRRVAVYSSHPDELQVAPDTFLLVSGALTELVLSFRPLVPGRLDVIVNVVDTDTNELVHALLIATDARTPTITKTFEVELQPGAPANKKITYTNPYPTPRSFYLRSTHPWLVHFRPERLDLPENGTRHVGLTFNLGDRQRTKFATYLEVLIFVNDEEDKNEECFRVRVHVL